MKKIGLLMISFVIIAQAEFSRGTNDLTVIDSETKLEWQDSYKDNHIPFMVLSGSITYCEELELDSHDDWRLPNINELKTIVLETQYAPSIATGDDKFRYTDNNNYYWSSTHRRYAGNGWSWVINFANGIIDTTSNAAYTRCVRDAD